MTALHELYRIDERNLAARREFISLRAKDIRMLSGLRNWAEKAIPHIVREFYDHQFAFPATAEFFDRFAALRGCSLAELRTGLERTQRAYLSAIFQEAAEGGSFGTEYFETRLRVGRVHNTIDLPLKWYVGSYMKWFDLFAARLRHDRVYRPIRRRRAERALLAVFNLDCQAVVEAFYYDTFASMSVDLAAIETASASHDLSDHATLLKGAVQERLDAVAEVSLGVREASGVVASGSAEASQATSEVALAITEVARGAERQVEMVRAARHAADEVADTIKRAATDARHTSVQAEEAQIAAREGLEATSQANEAMIAMRHGSETVTVAIEALASKSEQVGTIVATIAGIADQTNLLALNAAIEAPAPARRVAASRSSRRRCESWPRNLNVPPARSQQ